MKAKLKNVEKQQLVYGLPKLNSSLCTSNCKSDFRIEIYLAPEIKCIEAQVKNTN
jgi:hypothetical protein